MAIVTNNLQSMIRDLQRRKARGRRGLALVEGVRLVEEALTSGLTFKGVLVAPDLARTTRGRELRALLETKEVPVQEVSPSPYA
jgi:tRNA G18 (ribose-2'-O)-methylase SpoU